MRKFAAIYLSEDVIELIDNGENGFEVLGHLITHMEERIDNLKDDKEDFTREEVYKPLNMDTGYYWSINTRHGMEYWYLLDRTVKDNA